MSSEAAQKVYPEDEWSAGANAIAREAFDAGAVEALRQAAEKLSSSGMHSQYWDGQRVVYALFECLPNDRTPATVLNGMADDWVVGQ